MTRGAFIALVTSVVLPGGCTRFFDVDVTSIDHVDAYPTVRFDFNMPRDQPSPEEARHGFVRVRFVSPIDLEAEAASRDVPFVSFNFYPCGEAKTYSTSGDIFPSSAFPSSRFRAPRFRAPRFRAPRRMAIIAMTPSCLQTWNI